MAVAHRRTIGIVAKCGPWDESGRSESLPNLEPGRYCALVLDSPPRGPAFAFSKEAEEKLCKRISAGQTTNF